MSKIITQDVFERILDDVSNPSSYIGVEQNAVRKNPSEVAASIALVFPDLYEIGTSHLGLKILYSVINAEADLAAERAFAPGEDFASALAREEAPLMSLESKRPLADFDAVGFTIPYELSYTTILWILDLARIPLRAADRDDSHPVIIGGGAGIYNPEPVAEFFDLFVLGDGEKVTPLLLREIAASRGRPRAGRIRELSRIEGVYAPSLFRPEYGAEGLLKKVEAVEADVAKPKRVWLPTLSESPFPEKMVVPFGKTAHDRLNVEIDRGCTQACRFCQAGTTYRPVRERTPEEIMDIFEGALKTTGYGDISLTSLSAGDYSHMRPLLKGLMDRYEGERVSISLPSLRPGTVTDEIVDQIKRVRRTGFTIAAEAGTTRLRNALNKKVTDEEILDTAKRLLEAGWRSLKLYFMIGLPTETMEDVEAIYTLAEKLDRLDANGARFRNISISVSNFVPKPHTAFQWAPQDTISSLVAKKEKLFELIRPRKRLRLKWHDAQVSHLEAVFARGDRRLCAVVEKAYRLGRRLDAWSDKFDFHKWMEAFEAEGVDPAFYANREFGLDETLPWDHIDTGLSKKYFARELELARKGEVTQDCKYEKCLACGLNPKICFENYDWKENRPKRPTPPPPEGRFRYRLTYQKKHLARYLPHLETMAVIFRAFRMAGLPVAYSEGFSPSPRISFGPATPLGLESAEEYLDVEMTHYLEPWSINNKLNKVIIDDFHFIEARQIAIGEKSISSQVTSFDFIFRISELDRDYMTRAIEDFNRADKFMAQKKEGAKEVDIRPMVSALKLADGDVPDVSYTASFSPAKGFVRPDTLAKALFQGQPFRLLRAAKLKTALSGP